MTNKNLMFFLLVAMVVGCVASEKESEADTKRPNIIFIISDDQSYDDYGFMKHEHIQTPNIDRLAKESMTFTRGYASAPLCSPSLASIITGLYAFQHGITGNDPVVEYEGPKKYGQPAEGGIYPPNSYPVKRNIAYQKLAANFYENRLITGTLSEAGYRSFQTGKWWVGSAEDAGFDKGMTHGDFNRGGRHGDEGLKIAREGLDPIFDFIEESDSLNQPFFIWYAPFLPHTPHNPPQHLEEKYLKVAPSPFVAKYWAMVEWFDQTTGDLLDHLVEKGLEENTLIVYTCDNGWIQSIDARGYAPRSKRAPFEDGIRTPIMFKYPNVIEPGSNTESVVSNVDLVPTVMNLLGLEPRGLPGINILDDEELTEREVIFAEAYNHDIINVDAPSESILYKIAVEQRWKLLLPNIEMVKEAATSRRERIDGYYSNEVQLFDLHTDPEEMTNVASEYPAEVQRLSKAINDWWMVP